MAGLNQKDFGSESGTSWKRVGIKLVTEQEFGGGTYRNVAESKKQSNI